MATTTATRKAPVRRPKTTDSSPQTPETQPTPPDTAPEAPETDLVTTEAKPPVQRPNCGCGCGEPVNGAHSRYLPGHDAKLKSKILSLAYNGKVKDADSAPFTIPPLPADFDSDILKERDSGILNLVRDQVSPSLYIQIENGLARQRDERTTKAAARAERDAAKAKRDMERAAEKEIQAASEKAAKAA